MKYCDEIAFFPYDLHFIIVCRDCFLKRLCIPNKIYKQPKKMKRCSTSIVIKEMQIKTAMRYNFTPMSMAIKKKKKKQKMK